MMPSMNFRALLGTVIVGAIGLFAAPSALAVSTHMNVSLSCDGSTRSCPKGATIEAFFETTEATSYNICARFPNGARRCADDQSAEPGKLYLNKIKADIAGIYVVTWEVGTRKWRRHLRVTPG
jgi:hypothetical protein